MGIPNGCRGRSRLNVIAVAAVAATAVAVVAFATWRWCSNGRGSRWGCPWGSYVVLDRTKGRMTGRRDSPELSMNSHSRCEGRRRYSLSRRRCGLSRRRRRCGLSCRVCVELLLRILPRVIPSLITRPRVRVAPALVQNQRVSSKMYVLTALAAVHAKFIVHEPQHLLQLCKVHRA